MNLTSKLPIGRDEIIRAGELLKKYKAGKANLEQRVVDDELWWELRHWEAMGRKHLLRPHTEVGILWRGRHGGMSMHSFKNIEGRSRCNEIAPLRGP